MENFDVAIIGDRIEGVTCAIYCARAGLKTLLIEDSEVLGDDFNNLKLLHRLKKQAKDMGVIFIKCEVHSLWYKNNPKVIYTDDGPIGSTAIVLAMGVSYGKLGIPLESMFHGCGINYHDSCSVSYLKGRTVAVFGKDHLAINHAITLSALSKQVYLIYPSDLLLALGAKVEVLKNTPNIVMLAHTLIYGIEQRNKKMTGINVIDKTTGNTSSLDCEIVYVSKKSKPNSKLCFPYVQLDKSGFIITDSTNKTNVEGVYAAGPIRSGLLEQAPNSNYTINANMAATDGAIAAINAIKYINS